MHRETKHVPCGTCFYILFHAYLLISGTFPTRIFSAMRNSKLALLLKEYKGTDD
jgi:hypothetical protein